MPTVKKITQSIEGADKAPSTTTPIKAAKRRKPSLKLTDSVLIRNGFHGTLVIKLPKSGFTVRLNEFGDEDYVELSDLKTLRGSSPKFFKNNWILIDDPDVIEFLRVGEFYKWAISIEEMDTLFDMETKDLIERVGKLSDGQKKTLVYTALEKIESGALDSRQKIKALEEALGVDLVEK